MSGAAVWCGRIIVMWEINWVSLRDLGFPLGADASCVRVILSLCDRNDYFFVCCCEY